MHALRIPTIVSFCNATTYENTFLSGKRNDNVDAVIKNTVQNGVPFFRMYTDVAIFR